MFDLTKTKLINAYDDGWNLNVLCDIVTQIANYSYQNGIRIMKIESIEDNSRADDENLRYDVRIVVMGDEDRPLYRMKLLYLKGQIMDGEEFHERYDEFYGGGRMGEQADSMMAVV